MNLFSTSYLLLLLFTFFSQAFSASIDGGGGSETQKLLSFKSSLSYPAGNLQNWVQNNHPCSFSGVTCSNLSHVSSIDLSNSLVSSDFASVFVNLLSLPYLETLYLKNCNITGTLNYGGRSLCSSVLSYVDLAENQLSGQISELSTFRICSGLKSLNLSHNLFEFDVGKNDSSAKRMMHLSDLHLLDLSYNRISGENVVQWVLSNPNGLNFLSLKGNKVAGALPEFNSPTLEFLDLSANNFSTELPQFTDCSNLQHLDFSSNKFSGDVSLSLKGCKGLTFLNISKNQFSVELPSFPAGGALQFVYLSGNDYQGGIPPRFLEDLSSTIIELDLSYNNLSGMVPENLGSCSSLQLLDISNNNFSGELPIDTLLKLSSLKNLVLSFNNFVGDLPESLSKMINLETLDLSSNNITGFIPLGLCQDPRNSFKVLYLQNNMLSGPIPESLSNCSELVSLDLSFNYLTGIIPSSLGKLSKLRDLIFWLNLLHGEIPQELMYINALENLILDFNDLTGSIPSSLSNCTNLNWISLSNNILSGEIPPSLGSLANLAILKLGNNSFSGSIPSELGDCRSLIWLDLNTNFLSGTIPPALFKQSGNIAAAYLTRKQYVYIKNDGSKQCHGAGNLLEFGGIRQEQLHRISGRHPCNFTRVYRGMTQPTFNHNGSMIFLDLSYNNLEGGIPKELGSMYYLSILILGHNDLAGPLPDELGGLKNVAILDLSYNGFNGSIPHAMTSLTLLGEVDLSNNNLTGPIPESAPFDTFPPDRFLNNSGLCG